MSLWNRLRWLLQGQWFTEWWLVRLELFRARRRGRPVTRNQVVDWVRSVGNYQDPPMDDL